MHRVQEKKERSSSTARPKRHKLDASPWRVKAHALKELWVLHRQQYHFPQLTYDIVCSNRRITHGGGLEHPGSRGAAGRHVMAQLQLETGTKQ
jgi:hypothetical protein